MNGQKEIKIDRKIKSLKENVSVYVLAAIMIHTYIYICVEISLVIESQEAKKLRFWRLESKMSCLI